jgi:RNA polymerase sigma-70 factor (ECF subfamily)
VADTSESELRAAIEAVRGGDSNAFAQVVEDHQPRLFGLLLMMMRDPDAAQDVMQEAFVRAYLNLERYDPQRKFYPWLATIAVRLAQNWLKQRDRRSETAMAALPEPADTDRPDTLGELIESETGRSLWSMVATLPQGERMAVLLHYREEMSMREIAGTLGITEGTVKTMLFRARAKLRTMVSEADAPTIENLELSGE